MLRCTNIARKVSSRTYSKVSGGAKPVTIVTPRSGTAAATGGINANVPGLSSRCVKPTSGPVGPGASHNADYKVPEYFCFDRYSFAEAEVEMAKYRCPQPSALKK